MLSEADRPPDMHMPIHKLRVKAGRGKPLTALAAAALLALVLPTILPTTAGATGSAALTADGMRRTSPGARLRVEEVEFHGNQRTSRERALAAAGLVPGAVIDPAALQQAAARLRAARLFRRVSVHTRPGQRPGAIVVVFRVKEQNPHLRLGAGYADLSGWYLIPVQLNLDNLTGRGERCHVSTRLGFRRTGIVAHYRRPQAREPRSAWHLTLRSESIRRLYFDQGIEISHPLERSALVLGLDRPFGPHATVRAWGTFEGVTVDSSADAHSTRPDLEREVGDELAFEALPPGVRAAVGERRQGRLGLGLLLDSRRGAGLTNRGFWGETYGEFVTSTEARFAAGHFELRGYRPLGSRLQLAARTRCGAVSARAPFYERFYVGGLYTVRGYPSQSLSPAAGDIRLALATLELRGAWIGPTADPVLAAILFLDASLGWDGGAPNLDRGAAGCGYGLRVRLPWIGYAGLDVGLPLSRSPVLESFHLNLSIGWTF